MNFHKKKCSLILLKELLERLAKVMGQCPKHDCILRACDLKNVHNKYKHYGSYGL